MFDNVKCCIYNNTTAAVDYSSKLGSTAVYVGHWLLEDARGEEKQALVLLSRETGIVAATINTCCRMDCGILR